MIRVARTQRGFIARRARQRPELHGVYFVYSLLMGMAAILLSPYWLLQGLRHGKYLSNLKERSGFSFPSLAALPADRPAAIWMHAVSVGEVLSALPLAQKLKQAYPLRPLVISTTTITAQTLARERIPFADAVVYFPLDWTFCVRRAMQAIQPAIVIVLETEIWPNFLRDAGRRNIPVIFVSGRISDRSFTRYQNYLKSAGFFLRPLFRDALSNATAFLMQTQIDADRVRALGAPPERIYVSGNLKYDQPLPTPTPLSYWLESETQRRGRRPIIVAGSVVATEEPLALIAFGVFQGDYPNALLVLAPRKPERFQAAADFIHESKRKFVRRSELPITGNGIEGAGGIANGAVIPDDVTVLLLDSIGELASLYQLADGAFVGGSLVESGGHNILEPAAFGKIPVFGPSMENFAEIAARFVAAKAAIQVASPEDAGVAWIELLRDPQRQKQMGETAKHLVDSNRGATSRALSEIAKHLDGAPA